LVIKQNQADFIILTASTLWLKKGHYVFTDNLYLCTVKQKRTSI